MEEQTLFRLCTTLANALNTAVRLYQDDDCRCYHSAYTLRPDPVGPYLDTLLHRKQQAGIFVTPLYQLYGYLSLGQGRRLILGPSQIQNPDDRLEKELMFLLGVEDQRQDEYRHILHCFPAISAERMGCLISSLSIALNQCEPDPKDLLLDPPLEERTILVQRTHMQQCVESEAGPLTQHRSEYSFEKLLMSYVTNGEPERIAEICSAAPLLVGGPMADNTLRQVKNTCICAAALSARAAIAGGMDDAAAFRLSDLFIQQVELTDDLSVLEKLRNSILVDFARQVRQVRYHTALSGREEDKSFFFACAKYVSRQLYSQIRVDEMARALGYSRSYLCSRFKKQTGLTITRYIQQQKIANAQRMLELTDKSIAEIAALHAYSSQSHFQNVFKEVTGQTPQTFRRHRAYKPAITP